MEHEQHISELIHISPQKLTRRSPWTFGVWTSFEFHIDY